MKNLTSAIVLCLGYFVSFLIFGISSVFGFSMYYTEHGVLCFLGILGAIVGYSTFFLLGELVGD